MQRASPNVKRGQPAVVRKIPEGTDAGPFRLIAPELQIAHRMACRRISVLGDRSVSSCFAGVVHTRQPRGALKSHRAPMACRGCEQCASLAGPQAGVGDSSTSSWCRSDVAGRPGRTPVLCPIRPDPQPTCPLRSRLIRAVGSWRRASASPRHGSAERS